MKTRLEKKRLYREAEALLLRAQKLLRTAKVKHEKKAGEKRAA